MPDVDRDTSGASAVAALAEGFGDVVATVGALAFADARLAWLRVFAADALVAGVQHSRAPSTKKLYPDAEARAAKVVAGICAAAGVELDPTDVRVMILVAAAADVDRQRVREGGVDAVRREASADAAMRRVDAEAAISDVRSTIDAQHGTATAAGLHDIVNVAINSELAAMSAIVEACAALAAARNLRTADNPNAAGLLVAANAAAIAAVHKIVAVRAGATARNSAIVLAHCGVGDGAHLRAANDAVGNAVSAAVDAAVHGFLSADAAAAAGLDADQISGG